MLEENFHRIRRLPPYVFAEVNKLKAEARARGEDVIDLGMGNPDMPTPDHIVAKLVETVQDPRTHRYSQSRGILGLRKACAAYYQRRFAVELDPEREVIAVMGSKEGLANLAQAITSPGDVILAPNPCYPIHSFGFIMAGGVIRHLPAGGQAEQQGESFHQTFFRALQRAVAHSIPKPSIIVLNFPQNPTGQCVDLAFYQDIVDYCRKQEIYILSDLAYAEIYFGETPPPSILQVKHGREIAVEFISLSKTYNMPGWRVGFAVGNQTLIQALARMKSYVDYGAFTPIQVAAVAALNGPQDCVTTMRRLYKERRDVLCQGLERAGWPVTPPEASMFVWAPLPPRYANYGSVEFAKQLMLKAGVAVAPGVGFGEYGEGFVRFGLVENVQRIRQANRAIAKFLQNDDGLGG